MLDALHRIRTARTPFSPSMALLWLGCALGAASSGCGDSSEDAAPTVSCGKGTLLVGSECVAQSAGSSGSSAGGSAGSSGSSAGGSAGAGGGGPSGSICDAAPAKPPAGSCAAKYACNPVTGAGCQPGEACDISSDGFVCYPGDNVVGPCQDCSATFCQNTLHCADARCARFCCDDADCGADGVCSKDFLGAITDVGVCQPRACNGDADCTLDPTRPVCDKGRCIGCQQHTDCKDAARPLCDSGSCVACFLDADCKAPTPFCEVGSCVGCISDFDCPTDKPRCEQNACQGPCQGNADCKAPLGVCQVASGACVECAQSGDCKDPTRPFCLPDEGFCAECQSDGDCKDPAQPECSPVTHLCTEPAPDPACSAPGTAPSGGACGAAFACNPVTNGGCQAGEVCDRAGASGFACFPSAGEAKVCEACGADAPCGGTLTCLQGQCARFCCDSGDCGAGNTCDTSLGAGGVGVCVAAACKSDGDCAGDAAHPLCSGGSCVQCKGDGDCAADESKKLCDEAGSCVQCKVDNDCNGGTCAAGACSFPGNCCEKTGAAGCMDGGIAKCVCEKDAYCCETSWDEQCVVEVVKYGCGSACPGTCASDVDCTEPGVGLCEGNKCVAGP